MDVRDLRYFIAIAEQGQLRSAAQRVGRSQPALTKCMHRLEAELGTPLFERRGRQLHITAVGKALLARARFVSQTMEAAAREAAEIADGRLGHVRVGTGTTTAACFFPGLFKMMIPRFPGVTFDVVVGLGDNLRQMLRDGALDLVIGPLLDGDTQEFTTGVFGADEMVVAASNKHPLAGRRVQMNKLVNENWLLAAQAPWGTQWLNRAFESRDLPHPRIHIQATTAVSLLKVVSQTSLITFISRLDLAEARGTVDLREIRVPELVLRRDLGFFYLKNLEPPAATRRLIELIAAHAPEMLRVSRA